MWVWCNDRGYRWLSSPSRRQGIRSWGGACQQLVAQLVSTAGNWCLQTSDSLKIKDCWKGIDPPDQGGPKHHYQQLASTARRASVAEGGCPLLLFLPIVKGKNPEGFKACKRASQLSLLWKKRKYCFWVEGRERAWKNTLNLWFVHSRYYPHFRNLSVTVLFIWRRPYFPPMKTGSRK